MTITLPSSLQPYLAILLPILFPVFASSLASLLGQDGFPAALNDAIAFIALILSATASAYAAGQLTGDTSGIISAVAFTATLLAHGALYKLQPYLTYLDFLQSLSVVKSKAVVQPVVSTPFVSNTAPPATVSIISTSPGINVPANTISQPLFVNPNPSRTEGTETSSVIPDITMPLAAIQTSQQVKQ